MPTNKNREIIITLFISLSLAMLCYIFSYVINGDSSLSKGALLMLCLKDKSTYKVLLDIIPPNIIVWSIIGFIDYLKSKKENVIKKSHTVVLVVFIIYLFWYIFYSVFNEVVGMIVINAVLIVIMIGILFSYFSEFDEEEV